MTDHLKRTPLFETHSLMNAKILEFAGWDMPIQYSSILNETKSVRSNAGIFDVSHMGRVEINGPDSVSLLNKLLSANIKNMTYGKGSYNLICNESGGIIDDCIVYRIDEEDFLLIPNASNTDIVLDWLYEWMSTSQKVHIKNVSSDYSMIAHQGPRAADMLNNLTNTNITTMKPFTITSTEIIGVEILLARTGYTGEDGFELIIPNKHAPKVWTMLADSGSLPCGLGARDVLRLEAGLLLHGNDMDTSYNPYESCLDRFVDLSKQDYVAKDALQDIKNKGVNRLLVGFTLQERRIPRPKCSITVNGKNKIGTVTSGAFSPTLDTSIGLGYVHPRFSSEGSTFMIDIRGNLVEATVTSLPFYSRRKNK